MMTRNPKGRRVKSLNPVADDLDDDQPERQENHPEQSRHRAVV
jgi:hypothetical protein